LAASTIAERRRRLHDVDFDEESRLAPDSALLGERPA